MIWESTVQGNELLVLCLAIVFAVGGAWAEQVLAVQVGSMSVDSTVPADEKPGIPPFEIIWAARSEFPPAQVAFDHLDGWTMSLTGDAEVSVRASVAQRIWRQSVAKLSYQGGTQRSIAVLQPPKPIVIAEPFDAAKVWVFGGWYRRGQDDANPPKLAILLKDQSGQTLRIECGAIVSGNWSIEQGVLPPAAISKARLPLSFTGLEFSDIDFPGGASDLYLESLTFYQQHRDPRKHAFRPLHPNALTSDDGMLPTPPEGVVVGAEKIADGVRFVSQSPDGKLVYEVHPTSGPLDGIVAKWREGASFQPAKGGGLRIDGSGGNKESILLAGKIVRQKLDAEQNVYQVVWRSADSRDPLEFSASYSLRGRTLVVDLACAGGQAAGTDFGRVAGLQQPRGVFVPYMAFERIGHVFTAGPLIACAPDVFVSVLPDAYHSDFSTLDNTPSDVENDSIRLFASTSYLPLTDGRRNDLRDRVLITASPEFRDILPNARNRVSPNRQRLANYMLFSTYYPCLEMFAALKRLGVDNVIVMDKNSTLTGNDYQGLASFSTRWRPMPGITIGQWQNFLGEIRKLGYLSGSYSFFPDLHPVNEFWDENKVALRSDGSLAQGDWYGDYALKITDASRMVAAISPLIKELYAPELTYLDISSNMGPSAIDFEAGVEGAGTGRINMLGNIDVMLEAREHYGMTVSEGYHRWLYAGAVDADYATMLRPPAYKSAADVPPIVDFDLLKIHPFEHGTMMSFEPRYFLDENGQEWDALVKDEGRGIAPIGFYKYLAASLAYGHMAMLGYDYVPPPARVVQFYALMHAVQREYLTDDVKEIAYHDGAEFLSTSDAIRRDAVKQGRVRVQYSRGLSVYANLNHEKPWTVQLGDRAYELPPDGWVIEKPGELVAFSATVDGHRVDAVRSAAYTYVNTGDAPVRLQEWGIELQGAAWLKPQESGGVRVIPCGDLGTWAKYSPDAWPAYFFAFRLGEIPETRGLSFLKLDARRWCAKEARELTIQARDFDGKDLPAADPELSDDGKIVLRGQKAAVDFLVK